MKIYKDKGLNLVIVYGPNEEPGSVNLVKDNGPGNHRNFFGGKLERFRYHYTSINAGHSSSTDKLSNILDEDDKRYLLKRSKQK